MPFSPPAIQRLGEVLAPTLVLVGEHDGPDFQGIADALAAGIPRARREVLPGAGHLGPVECPLAFNERVIAFLNEHDPPR